MGYEQAPYELAHFHEGFFSVDAHRRIFRAICAVKDAGQRPVPAAVNDHLQRTGELEWVGGAGEVTSISLETGTPATAPYAAQELLERFGQTETARIGDLMKAGAMPPVEAMSALERLADETRPGHGLSVRSARELLTLKLDEHDCLLGDRIMAKGQLLSIVGPGGIGKSRALLQQAACCISGRPWLGFETHARGLRWLIIQTENNNRRLQTDLKAINYWLGDSGWLDSLFVKTVENDQDGFLSLSDLGAVQRLRGLVKDIAPDIVAFDPLRDFSTGDLNSDADMVATLHQLGSIARAGNPNRAVVLLHHALTGKAAAGGAYGLNRTSYGRNSKALFGWTRAQINISPASEDNNDTILVTCGKNSNGKEFESFAAVLNPATMIYEVDDLFDLEGWKEQLASNGKAKKLNLKPSLVVEIIGSEKFTRGAIVAEIRERTGCAKTPAYDLITTAEQSRLVKQSKGGNTIELFR